jgi:outer membrane lipoprotein-sorting protein
VYVAAVPPDDRASTPALFLAGKGSLTRDFTVSAAAVPAGAPAGSAALKLVPTRGDRDYDWLVLVVDDTSLAWRMLVTGDRQGGESTFTFRNMRENRGVPDREFMFQIPRGVDVIAEPAPRP